MAKISNILVSMIYLLPLVVAWVWWFYSRHRHEQQSLQTWGQASADGLTEPAALHPVVDPNLCIGSSTCVSACPEQAIGIIDGKAQLINPAACIGHGACERACPMSAIRLVFGTEQRGVDIPVVDPHFQTNVPGLYIAGELGGMGLIHKAVTQGKEAIENIVRAPKKGAPLQLVIIGAGPAGLSASLAAQAAGLKFITLEQEAALGGTIYHYPRRKVAMTVPMRIPLIGELKTREISKEQLLQLWQRAHQDHALPIQFGQRMQSIAAQHGHHCVITEKGAHYETDHVLLSIGRRGTPRRLDVPGETQAHVVYRLIDPLQYRNQQVLVVGGGDSAVEAALSLYRETNAKVYLSYRGETFNRLKVANRQALQSIQDNRLRILLRSQVLQIDQHDVQLRVVEREVKVPVDSVIICVGGVLPSALLRTLGVTVNTHYGE